MNEKFLASQVSEKTLLQLPQWITKGIIAIDGYSGSGKTTLAHKIYRAYQDKHFSVNLIHCDWFATWDNPVGWWDTMYGQVIEPLLRGEAVWFEPMMWRDGKAQLGGKQYLERSTVIIIEGFSAARLSMQHLIDYAIWVDGGSAQQCLERAIARDGQQYRNELTQWKQFEAGWFAVDDTPARCHRITLDDE